MVPPYQISGECQMGNVDEHSIIIMNHHILLPLSVTALKLQVPQRQYPKLYIMSIIYFKIY